VEQPDTSYRPWSVSELAREIRSELSPLTRVLVKGEVSGMNRWTSGHYGFTVKDAGAQIGAVVWADTARRLPILPEDGHEFIFKGKVDFWPKTGQLRLVVDSLEFDDIGKMRAELEKLKHRLEEEGAFDSARKRPLPFLPRVVALITSPTGAVIHDLQQTIWERFPNLEVLVYPTQVQGPGAPSSVAGAMRRCNEDGLAEVVIIARGGGSFEELYGFNTEVVVRAILASRIPVITALGHTSDRTLADMVADVECRTPTAAGERVVPIKAELLAMLNERDRRVRREAELRISALRTALNGRRDRVDRAGPQSMSLREGRLLRAWADLSRLSPLAQMNRRLSELSDRRNRVEVCATTALRSRSLAIAGLRAPERARGALNQKFHTLRLGLVQRESRVRALSPEAVLARGYSITHDAKTGAVLTDSSQTTPGQRIRVRLAIGVLEAGVLGVTNDGND
jgi:exodeoxyribonuclease VII large subunit